MSAALSLDLIEQYASAAPISKWLGFSAAVENSDVIFNLAFGERHIGNQLIRALHGGGVAAFLEFAAQAALFAELNGEKTVTTVNTDIDYMSSASARDMKARVRFSRIGRRLAFVEAVGWQKEEAAPVASARFRLRISDGRNSA